MRPLFITLFKVIASALFLVLLIGCRTHAAMYPFTASFDGTSIVATMTGVPDDTTQYQLYNNSTPLTSSNLATTTDTSIQTQIGGTVTWTIAGRALVNGTYNLHVEKVVPADQTPPTFPGTTFPGSPAPAGVALTDTVSVTVAGSTADFFEWPLLTASPTGQTIVVAGKIDTSLYSSPLSALQIKLEYSTAGTITGDKHAIAHSSLGTSSVEGVADDGSYYFELSALTPKTKYYYRQTITDATNAVLSTKDLYFDSTAGYVPAGSLAEQDLEAPYTYHLLAPWPGLHALYDPALCQQKKVEGKIAQNAVCDVNGFINFAFKTLIGLTAVILVLRLVLIGYEYMTTDTPFKKASSKDAFFTSLMGLLLALASYLILNTINPKLVNNTFDVSGVNVGVTQFTFSGVNEVYTTTNGVKTKVNSLKLAELFPHAKTVSLSTGVPITTILGILQVETHLNTGDGGCVWDAPGVMRSDNVRDDKAAYQQIIATIPGATVNDHKVSCPVAGIVGYGGGMGASQHIPTTWKGLTPAIKAASGKNYADPWDLDDAIYALAVHIKNDGGISDPQNAACKYYSGHACGTQQADSQPNGNLTYRDRFNSAVAAIQAEITKQNLQ